MVPEFEASPNDFSNYLFSDFSTYLVAFFFLLGVAIVVILVMRDSNVFSKAKKSINNKGKRRVKRRISA